MTSWTQLLIKVCRLYLFCVLTIGVPLINADAASPPSGTTLINFAGATYTDANGNTVYTDAETGETFKLEAGATVESVIGGAPRLEISLLADKDPVVIGGRLTYTIQYRNVGNVPATHVTLSDGLSRHLIFGSASNSGTTIANPDGTTVVVWDIGSLEVGEAGAVTVATQVKTPADYPPGDSQPIGIGTRIDNTASIQSTETGPATAAITTTVGGGPMLVIHLTATEGTITPGGTITYAVTYRNTGNQEATNVRLVDQLPTEVAYVEGSLSVLGLVTDGRVQISLGSVAPGAEGQVGFQVGVSPLTPNGAGIKNTAVILSNELGPIASNQTVNPVVATAGTALFFMKLDSPDPVYAGNTLSYSFELTNDGATPLTNVEIHDSIPLQTNFIEADEGGGCAQQSGDQCTEVVWIFDSIMPGETKAFHLRVKLSFDTPAGTIITNSAVAYAQELPIPSPSTATTVSERTPGLIEFLDAKGNLALSYKIGNIIYLQVTDPDRNTDRSVIETVDIVIGDTTNGDRETVTLTATGPATGVFRGSLSSMSKAAVVGDGVLSVSAKNTIIATYTDPLDAVPVTEDSALIDPLGVVFDSMSGEPIAGAVVTLVDDGTGQPADLSATATGFLYDQDNAVTTDENGWFQFEFVPPGTYHVEVVPPAEHTYPSLIDDAEMASGFVVLPQSRGASFTLEAGDQALYFDIPVDPVPGTVTVRKEADKRSAAIGDLITYTLTITNTGTGESAINDLRVLDTLPPRIQYLNGSTSIDKAKAADPARHSRTLTWRIPALAQGATMSLRYSVLVGVGTPVGDAVNRVVVTGTSAGTAVTSNTAQTSVKITGGVFTDQTLIIGKVFADKNGNGMQNGPGESPPDVRGAAPDSIAPETGIAGVVLYMEDGTRVETDKNGKFSIQPVSPGTHVLRLDETTLPAGFIPAGGDNRFMGDGASRFVDVRPGLICKADFAVRADGGSRNIVTPQVAVTMAQPVAEDPRQAEDPAENSKKMTSDLDFVEPSARSTVQMDQIKVVLKTPTDMVVSLSVNGRPIDAAAKLGKKITNRKNNLDLYEYIGVELKPGAVNTLRAEMRDPFGNLRGHVERQVVCVGRPAKIVLTPDRDAIPADGKSVSRLIVGIQDAQGNTLQYPRIVSLEADRGTILTEDADPLTPGRQVSFENGLAAAVLQSDYQAGKATITAVFDDLEAQTDVFFSPDLRTPIVVGLGEITFGQDSDQRGAFFAKGDIGKGVLLTTSYDSGKKEDPDNFFRADDLNLETEDKYSILGDESSQGYDALSTDKFYLKLEKDRSSLLYGDFQTDLTKNKLNAYVRTFNGLKADVVTDKFALRSFISHTGQSQKVDILPGRGISGFYSLTAMQIIEGSERVTIETRDRFRPERVLERVTLTRYTDYSIDYQTGSLLFKAPVPSYDDAWNPIFVVVHYESEASSQKVYNYGGRAAIKPASWVEVGVTGVIEENEIYDFQLYGMDAGLSLPGNTVIKGEYSHTNALFDLDDSLRSEAGHGWAFNLETKPDERFTLTADYQNTSDYFGNISAPDASRGKEKYGLDAAYLVRPDVTVYAEHFTENDKLNDITYSNSAIGAEKQFTKTTVSLELSHEKSSGDYVVPSEQTPLSLSNISVDAPAEPITSAKIGIKIQLRPNLSLLAGHKQEINGNAYSLSQAGVDYQLNDLNRLYLRQEYGRFDEREETRTIFGGETKVIKNTVAFNEYRLDAGTDGNRNQQVIGLRNKLMLAKNVTGNFTLENIKTLRGSERTGQDDAVAVTAGLEYLASEKTKMSSRLEYRVATENSDAYSWLAEVGITHKLSDNQTLLFKELYVYEKADTEMVLTSSRLQLGMAYRPTTTDRFNGLLRSEWKHKKDESSALSEDILILSNEGVYQLNQQTQLIGKYACKFVDNGNTDSFTDLIAVRILYDLTERIDLGAEYRIQTSHATGAHVRGASLETGYRVLKNLWASLGYSFASYDEDLATDYNNQGAYLRFRFKFDEHLLVGR